MNLSEGEIRIGEKPVVGNELERAIDEALYQTPHEAVHQEELSIEARRKARLGHIAKEIEFIFLREDLTMAEMAEVLDLFNARAHAVFSKMKIKEIKDTYERT